MTQIWVAYDHTIHYKVDLDAREVTEVVIPGWINTFGEPGTIWSDNGVTSLTEQQEDDMLDILENESLPDPYWE